MSKRTINISRMVVMLVLFCLQGLQLKAQQGVAMGGCKEWRNGGWVEVPCATATSSTSGGGGWNITINRRARISKADRARQQRLDEAQAANDQGIKYWGDWEKAIPFFEEAVRKDPDDPIMRDNLARAQAALANNKGIAFFNKQDYNNAVTFFQEAANKDPDNKSFQDNLIRAKEELGLQHQEQQNKDATVKMQQSIQTFTQTLNTVPSTGGLDFDGNNSTTSANKNDNSSSLQFGDPNVVVVTNLPSDLPKAADDAITGAYKNSPPGVSERVRKGFQAVMTKDWKAAKAWFQDALLHDPGNQGLQKFIDLCDYTPGNNPAANTSNNKQPAVVPGPNTPGKVEIDDFFNNFNAGVAFTPSEKVRKYVLSMSKEEFKKQLDLHLTIKQINELMFENLIKEVEQEIPGSKKPQ